MKDNEQKLHSIVEEREPNICEITVVRDNMIIYEDFWHGYKPGDALNVMSVTKSVMAILTGIAIDLGYIASVDSKVMDFFPDYQTKRGEKTIFDVKLSHLLTMTAPYKYKSEPWTRVCTSEDWTRAALDLLGGKSGISGEFKYSTLGIQILGGIIENASGMKLIDFANRYLFECLGIERIVSHGDSGKEDQFDYLMNKNPRKHEWYCDPKGCATSGWGLSLSATDLALIGNMLCNKGCYRDNRIVSAEWIDKMKTPNIQLGERFGNMSYGYLWWIPDCNKEVFTAIGDGGNVIYVNPSEGISVGVAASFKPRVFGRVDFIEKEVLRLIL